jgi:calcineurin-like phosphoesterase family protein
MDWFSSDLHLGHFNIIRYSNRPFASVKEMDDTLINNINALVKPEDTLWFLGDFCFGPREPHGFFKVAESYRNRINCKNIILIWGNHDPNPFAHKRDERHFADRFARLFVEDYGLRNTTIMGQKMTLCHYSMRTWDKSHHGAFHLYGHSHGSLPDDPNALSFDCGVDCHGYKPINFQEVVEIMKKKTFKPVDHHGERDNDSRRPSRNHG